MTAAPALLVGRANLGPKVDNFKPEEVALFREKFGAPPVSVAVAFDALAVFVHKDNPIESLSLKQVDAIFSSTRKHGHSDDITTWGNLGLEGKFKDARIAAFGRNSASGTYGYFKMIALAKGDFKYTVKEHPGSLTVVKAVGDDPLAIGYSGLGYKTDAVRAVALVGDDGKPVTASLENVVSGNYPLGRRLFVAMTPLPKAGLEPLRREYFRLVFSRQGQEIVVKDGYMPLPFDVAEEEAKKVGIVFEAAKRP